MRSIARLHTLPLQLRPGCGESAPEYHIHNCVCSGSDIEIHVLKKRKLEKEKQRECATGNVRI